MRTFLLLAAAVLVASTAHAQNPTPAPTTGPLVLERIHDAWIVAPDFKVTDLDDRTGELAGAYGGRVFDNTLLVGGAGYWLTNEARDFKMAYGGLLIGWQSREFGRIRFGGRGLAGGGTATLGFDVTSARAGDIRFGVTVPPAPSGVEGRRLQQPQTPPRVPVPQIQTRPARLLARDEFAVFEPQANVSARITKGIGVSCGVGYRETVGADILNDRLNGPTANLAIQFGW